MVTMSRGQLAQMVKCSFCNNWFQWTVDQFRLSPEFFRMLFVRANLPLMSQIKSLKYEAISPCHEANAVANRSNLSEREGSPIKFAL